MATINQIALKLEDEEDGDAPVIAVDNLHKSFGNQTVLNGISLTVSRAGSSERCDVARSRNLLYLFACHLEWKGRQNVEAYQELIAALDDTEERIRVVAEMLLHRSSPHPQHCGRDAEGDNS
jgi:ABC-type histidine transport system ATPase subunit